MRQGRGREADILPMVMAALWDAGARWQDITEYAANRGVYVGVPSANPHVLHICQTLRTSLRRRSRSSRFSNLPRISARSSSSRIT